MIKLIHVFDKVIDLQSFCKSEFAVEDVISESLCSINVDDLTCPICGGKETLWQYRYARPHRFIWENPDQPVSVLLPTYQYHCDQCRGRGTETITTDIAIGKTALSYHYLFKLLRTKRWPFDRNAYELCNLLYGMLSEESMKRWKARFLTDYAILSMLADVQQEDLLFERIDFGTAFRLFYLSQKRFFMDDSRVRGVIDIQQGNLEGVK